MTRDEIKEATQTVKGLICRHMSSAAIASGWVSPVDATAFIREVSDQFPYGTRPENLGLTALTGWLAERGVEAGETFIRELRKEWIKEEMREYCKSEHATT